MAKNFVGQNTLRSFMTIVKNALDGKATTQELQTLKSLVESLQITDGKVADSDKLDGLDSAAFVKVAELIQATDALTEATDKAVASKVVFDLKAKIDSIVSEEGGVGHASSADMAEDSKKLGGQLPAYYATEAGLMQVTQDLNLFKDTVTNGYVSNETFAAYKTEADGKYALKTDVTALTEKVTTIETTYMKTADADAKFITPAAVDAKISTATASLATKTELTNAVKDVVKVGTDGLIPSNVLPSYVDDVVEGYLNAGKFYKEEAHTTLITGEKSKIYVDLHTNVSYRYSGTAYVAIVSNDMVEITADEVQQMWDEIVGA